MKRLLLIALVAAMLVLAGCVDGTGTETGEPIVDADDSLEDSGSNGAEDDTEADEEEAE